MKFNIHGKNIEITDSIEAYIEEKVGKLHKYFGQPDDMVANILVKVKGLDQKIEVTIPTKNVILRAEEASKDLYAAIDLVSEKLERQIRKSKTKMQKHRQKERYMDFSMDYDVSDEDNKIVKRKLLDLVPMSEEDAIVQMEMLGHDFFVFKNSDLEEICVLYKRKDNDFGMLIAEEN